MSELNLEQSGQFEVNAKNPTAVLVLTDGLFNIKMGKRWNYEQQANHYGFVAKGYGFSDMGKISDTLLLVDQFPLTVFQINDETGAIIMDFNGEQPFSADSIDITVGDGLVTATLVWNATNSNYEGTIQEGFEELLPGCVGGNYPMSIEETP